MSDITPGLERFINQRCYFYLQQLENRINKSEIIGENAQLFIDSDSNLYFEYRGQKLFQVEPSGVVRMNYLILAGIDIRSFLSNLEKNIKNINARIDELERSVNKLKDEFVIVKLDVDKLIDNTKYITSENNKTIISSEIESPTIDDINRLIDTKYVFHGYFETNEQIMSIPASNGDFAWSGESRTVWSYYSGTWNNTMKIAPIGSNPSEEYPKDIGFISSPGTSDLYSRGDHIHKIIEATPTDLGVIRCLEVGNGSTVKEWASKERKVRPIYHIFANTSARTLDLNNCIGNCDFAVEASVNLQYVNNKPPLSTWGNYFYLICNSFGGGISWLSQTLYSYYSNTPRIWTRFRIGGTWQPWTDSFINASNFLTTNTQQDITAMKIFKYTPWMQTGSIYSLTGYNITLPDTTCNLATNNTVETISATKTFSTPPKFGGNSFLTSGNYVVTFPNSTGNITMDNSESTITARKTFTVSPRLNNNIIQSSSGYNITFPNATATLLNDFSVQTMGNKTWVNIVRLSSNIYPNFSTIIDMTSVGAAPDSIYRGQITETKWWTVQDKLTIASRMSESSGICLGADFTFFWNPGDSISPNGSTSLLYIDEDSSGSQSGWHISPTGGLSGSSSRKWKKNIKSIENGILDKINEIDVVSFNRCGYCHDNPKKDEKDTEEKYHEKCLKKKNRLERKEKEKHIGVIAQDLMKLFPDCVSGENDDNYCVNFTNLNFYLLKAVQELSSEVKTLKQEILLLKNDKPL